MYIPGKIQASLIEKINTISLDEKLSVIVVMKEEYPYEDVKYLNAKVFLVCKRGVYYGYKRKKNKDNKFLKGGA
jgi:hypothetical protein